jgi:hypothetical protein
LITYFKDRVFTVFVKGVHFVTYLFAIISVFILALKVPEVNAGQLEQNFASRDMTLTEILRSKETCEECHKKTTQRIFKEYTESAHGNAGVGCADCHGSDHENMPVATAKNACDQCHPQGKRDRLARTVSPAGICFHQSQKDS